MPAFGFNRFTIPFVQAVNDKEVAVSGDGSEGDPFVYSHIGFRLSDRILSALDRLFGDLVARFATPAYPGLTRFAYIYPFAGACDWSHAMNIADEEGGYTKYEILWAGTVTHNANGILGGTGNTQADGGWGTAYPNPQGENWVYKTFGFYSRTNNAAVDKNMQASASNTNGYTYNQGIHPRYSDGNAYFDNCLYSGPASGGNRIPIAVTDSLGLYGCSRELGWPGYANLFRAYKRNVQLAYESTAAQPLSGQGGGVMMIYPTSRTLSFVFATKGYGGPANVYAFLNYPQYLAFADCVQRFQVGMARAV